MWAIHDADTADTAVSTWLLSWQDWPEKTCQPRPLVHREHFDNRAQAEQRKQELKALGYVVCVTPKPPVKRRKPPPRLLNGQGEPRFNAGWKLHH